MFMEDGGFDEKDGGVKRKLLSSLYDGKCYLDVYLFRRCSSQIDLVK